VPRRGSGRGPGGRCRSCGRRRGVAEGLGDALDRGVDRPLLPRLRPRRRLRRKLHRRQHGAVPGAKVLGREVIADLGLDVVVDVDRADVAPGTVLAEDEQILGAAATAAHCFDRPPGGGVANRLQPPLPTLGGEFEDHLAVFDRDVLTADRRQPIALVRLRVLLAADPEEAEVELAAGVDPGRLDVAERVGADPDLLPGPRDPQAPHPLQRLLVLDPHLAGVEVGKAAAPPLPLDALRGAVGAPQAPGWLQVDGTGSRSRGRTSRA
jgi:hypothetical protein